ncbi:MULTISPECIES: hypothetical protein [unclassified Aureimonas]|nr:MULTISPECIES: hypothetical protein [unclassified Aureimonas]
MFDFLPKRASALMPTDVRHPTLAATVSHGLRMAQMISLRREIVNTFV